jgi:hypothetical protein
MWGSLRGVPVGREPIWLASKLPTAITGYRYEIDPLDAQVLTSLSLAAAPSGTGELMISALAFAAGIVTFTLAAGQPTRCYTLLLTATRSDGLVSDYLFKLRVGNVLTSDQPQEPSELGLGAAIVWPLMG